MERKRAGRRSATNESVSVPGRCARGWNDPVARWGGTRAREGRSRSGARRARGRTEASAARSDAPRRERTRARPRPGTMRDASDPPRGAPRSFSSSHPSPPAPTTRMCIMSWSTVLTSSPGSNPGPVTGPPRRRRPSMSAHRPGRSPRSSTASVIIAILAEPRVRSAGVSARARVRADPRLSAALAVIATTAPRRLIIGDARNNSWGHFSV